MISANLAELRKIHNLTQEETAEKIGVSRQAIAKWEKGESVPDLYNCAALAELFGVSIDELISHSKKKSGLSVPPKGKYVFGTVTVGERGQIVIPKKAREIFSINPGDNLVILGDENQGLAIIPASHMLEFINGVNKSIKGE